MITLLQIYYKWFFIDPSDNALVYRATLINRFIVFVFIISNQWRVGVKVIFGS